MDKPKKITQSNDAQLTPDQLLYQSLSYSMAGQSDLAIQSLEMLLKVNPKDARALFLLGSEYAQNQRYADAIEKMNKVIQFDPNMDIARFQLGMLYISSGRLSEAVNVWSGLDDLSQPHYLYLFKEGMLALSRDDLERSVMLLQQGIAENTDNLALNKNMRIIIRGIKDMILEDEKTTIDSTVDVTTDFLLKKYDLED